MDGAVLIVSSVAGLAGIATLIVTAVALRLTARQERRATERSNVDWYADEVLQGVIRVRNQGLDPAHEVTIEVWDRHDFVKDFIEVVAKNDAGTSTLDHRREHGPDEVDAPVQLAPPVPERGSAPEIPEALLGSPFADRLREGHEFQERLRKSQEQMSGEISRRVAEAQRKQVSIRVTWRSELGTWSTKDVDLS